MGIKDNIALQVKIEELQNMPQKIVHVPVEVVRVEYVEVARTEYVDNPAHIEMIRALQEKLRGMNG